MLTLILSEFPVFLASALLSGLVLLLVLGLWNCRLIIRGDWGDDSISPFEARPLPRWLQFLALSVPQMQFELRRIRRDMSRAGIYAPDAFDRLLAVRNGLVWCCLFAIPLVLILVPEAMLLTISFGVFLAAVFYAIPGLFLNARGRVRAGGILSAVPEIMDILSMCLSGGMTLEQALPRIVEYSPNVSRDLTKELQLVVRQARMSSAGLAFQQLAERIDEVELRSLAATVQHTERLGTDMKRAIDNLSTSIRSGLRSEAEARANSLSVKLLFPIILCVTPPVFFVLVVPPVLRLRDHFRQEFIPAGTEELIRAGSKSGGPAGTPAAAAAGSAAAGAAVP
ncbi:MAG: type II secretion system F family protein [Planctomycetaceae bacterium]